MSATNALARDEPGLPFWSDAGRGVLRDCPRLAAAVRRLEGDHEFPPTEARAASLADFTLSEFRRHMRRLLGLTWRELVTFVRLSRVLDCWRDATMKRGVLAARAGLHAPRDLAASIRRARVTVARRPRAIHAELLRRLSEMTVRGTAGEDTP